MLIIIALFVSCSRDDKNDFEKNFFDKTLRINLIHTGDTLSESFRLDKIYDDGLWYGRTKHLLNPYHLGAYYYEVKDIETEEVLYSDGMSTFFSEWRTTEFAGEGKTSFNESIRIPFPNRNAKLTLYRIDSLANTEPVWEYVIDRRTKALLEPTKNHNNRIIRFLDSGDPKEKVDIVILGDGYTADDIKLFDADALYFYNSFINSEPYKSRKSDFNIHAIQVMADVSGHHLMAHQSTFGHDRYALTNNEWIFREYAAQSPYDYAVILLNDSQNYGGSLYNCYTTSVIRSQSIDYVIRHGIGHQIAGYSDKFYSNEVACDTTEVSTYYCNFDDIINNILDLHTK